DVRSLASALAASDAVVCHDSLPGHLAAALGKPVVTIFGSGEPDWFAPWANRERAVQKRVCPLHPCIDRCGMDSYLCLEAVSVDDVAAKVMEMTKDK
ncbi:MAG: glycosyltransferase family 9 protein, partial [Chthoniobacterales bacterium]